MTLTNNQYTFEVRFRQVFIQRIFFDLRVWSERLSALKLAGSKIEPGVVLGKGSYGYPLNHSEGMGSVVAPAGPQRSPCAQGFLSIAPRLASV